MSSPLPRGWSLGFAYVDEHDAFIPVRGPAMVAKTATGERVHMFLSGRETARDIATCAMRVAVLAWRREDEHATAKLFSWDVS